jgi:hypothetical protein
LVSTSTNNQHVKPLILALMGNAFLNTRNDQAKDMLLSAYTMARSMGSNANKSKDKTKALPDVVDESVVGNPRLGLWLGEKLLQLYEAEGSTAKMEKQQLYNGVHRTALHKM